MKNPYKILGLSQDATQAEIARSQVKALRAKEHSMKEITEAQATLRKPASRLAADFTFPIFDIGEIQPITSTIQAEEIDWSKIDTNKYNSLTI